MDSPFKGTRQFGKVIPDSDRLDTAVFSGMCFAAQGHMSKIGTMLHVQEHQRQVDGQLVIVNKGIERFCVKEVVKTEPVVICEVEMLPDTPATVPPEVDPLFLAPCDGPDGWHQEIRDLSNEVTELYRNVSRLSRKVRGTDLEAYTEPDELNDMNPVELSFWFASLFTESQIEQQKVRCSLIMRTRNKPHMMHTDSGRAQLSSETSQGESKRNEGGGVQMRDYA